jgi:hypothetical protein
MIPLLQKWTEFLKSQIEERIKHTPKQPTLRLLAPHVSIGPPGELIVHDINRSADHPLDGKLTPVWIATYCREQTTVDDLVASFLALCQ